LEMDGFILKMEGEWKIERKDEELFLFWKWMEGERSESEIHTFYFYFYFLLFNNLIILK
jgi:hypothetical protein